MAHQPSHDPKKKAEGAIWRSLFTKGRLCFLFCALCIGAGMAGYGHYTDPGPLPEDRIVLIPHGASKQVIQTLQSSGIIAPGYFSHVFFQTALFLTKKQGGLHAAELKFPMQVSIAHSLDILRHGHPVMHSVTIAEGLTASRIKETVESSPFLQGHITSLEEGKAAPQTIFYIWGMERSAVLERMQNLMQHLLDSAWEKRNQEALQDVVHTPQELLILASLIEKETSVPSERPMIARVFVNRLKQNMRLQTDPTVIYALSHGSGVLDHSLNHADLQFDSPYNTYEHAGLPPGPICSPSKESLWAASHPASGDALYFVATGHGGHHFARTLTEHTENIRSYRHVH